MIQVFLFHGFAENGPAACRNAAAQVNRFLQQHEVQNAQFSTQFVPPHGPDTYSYECVVTVAGQVEHLIPLTREEIE